MEATGWVHLGDVIEQVQQALLELAAGVDPGQAGRGRSGMTFTEPRISEGCELTLPSCLEVHARISPGPLLASSVQ